MYEYVRDPQPPNLQDLHQPLRQRPSLTCAYALTGSAVAVSCILFGVALILACGTPSSGGNAASVVLGVTGLVGLVLCCPGCVTSQHKYLAARRAGTRASAQQQGEGLV
jgi:hypothetical protein